MTLDDLDHVLAAAGLGAARTVPLVWLVPAFGGHHLPGPMRVGLGIALAGLSLPVLLAAHLSGLTPLVLIILLAREVLVGLVLGLILSFAFRAVEAAGRFSDVLRGANMAEVLSPTSEERTSPLGDMGLLLAVVLFIEMGGLHRVVEALARSYQAVPIGADMSVTGIRAAAAVVTLASARLLEAALGLAAPVVVALLLADLGLGAVARVAPQVPVYFMAQPLKALLGVGVVLIGLGAIEAAFMAGLPGWLILFERGAAAFAP